MGSSGWHYSGRARNEYHYSELGKRHYWLGECNPNHPIAFLPPILPLVNECEITCLGSLRGLGDFALCWTEVTAAILGVSCKAMLHSGEIILLL